MNSKEKCETGRDFLIDSSDPAEIENLLASNFGVRKFDLIGDRDNYAFRFRLRHLQFGQICISRCKSNLGSLGAFSAGAGVLVRFHFNGNSEARFGTKRLRLSVNNAGIIPPHAEHETLFDHLYDGSVICADEKHLNRKLSAVIGDDIGTPLRFEIADAGAHPDIRTLRKFAADIFSEQASYLRDASPVVQAELSQALLLALLFGARHNYSDRLNSAPPEVAPGHVRRAIDYIECNWSKPLLVEEIAAAVDVNARSLFKTFKTFTGMSPMAYARHVRLKEAHRMLLNAGREMSVADVVLACGFPNAGHFAKDYRDAFGELPSDTLARARTLIRSPKRILI
jgi:AraC-like DNA-binding protein